MQITLRNIQYHPDTGNMAFLFEHRFGMQSLNSTETRTATHAPQAVRDAIAAATGAPSDYWGNAEALAEAQVLVDEFWPGDGFTVVYAPAPVPEPAPVPA